MNTKGEGRRRVFTGAPPSGGKEARVNYEEKGEGSGNASAPVPHTCSHPCMHAVGRPLRQQARRAAPQPQGQAGGGQGAVHVGQLHLPQLHIGVWERDGGGGDASAASPRCVVWEGMHALMKCQHHVSEQSHTNNCLPAPYSGPLQTHPHHRLISPLASDGGTPPLPSLPPFLWCDPPPPPLPLFSPRSS